MHFINGEWINDGVGRFESTNPATGETTWEGPAAGDKEIHEAVMAASMAFDDWAGLSLTERVDHLESFGKLLFAHMKELSEIICRDTGKPRWEANTEVAAMIDKISISVEAYEDRCRTVVGEMGSGVTAVRYKPLGVMGVIGPFNMPCHLPNGHIIPALLAGNTVVFKPSGQAPRAGQAVMELWQMAGIPAGVVNMVQGRGETGMALSTHPLVDGLFFTGSLETGQALHRASAGQTEKILVLEMGGNNPLVVHGVSNVKAAAYLTLLSAYITAGQRCTCARRLIVPEGDEGDRFVDALVKMVVSVAVGPYTDHPDPFMGTVISVEAAERLLAIQAELAEAGGEPLLEMKPLRGILALLSPGIMDVTKVKNPKDEEIFGPFLKLIRVPDFEAAVDEANKTAYGLSAALFSDDKDLYNFFFRKTRAGVVNWNRQTTGASSRLPFGGVGASGNHRPSAYYAADYCSYPIASIEADQVCVPSQFLPGISL
ncbi:MAG: succinylglutamate-semialdehyde dehydrogenase [Pseudomonadota bacterium]